MAPAFGKGSTNVRSDYSFQNFFCGHAATLLEIFSLNPLGKGPFFKSIYSQKTSLIPLPPHFKFSDPLPLCFYRPGTAIAGYLPSTNFSVDIY